MLYLLVNLIISYLFLIIFTLTLHEIGHAVTAIFCHVPIKKFGLSWKGAFIVRESGTLVQNILISFAGPITNILLGIFLLPTHNVWHLFAEMNLVLGITNLLPITGSDGDRILTCLKTIKKENKCPISNN